MESIKSGNQNESTNLWVDEQKSTAEQEESRPRNNILAAILGGKYVLDDAGRLLRIELNPGEMYQGRRVPQKQKEGALAAIRAGLISSSDMSKFIDSNVRAPWRDNDYDQILLGIGKEYENGVFRFMLKGLEGLKEGLNSRKQLRVEDVKMFIRKYDTPESFERGCARFLGLVEKVVEPKVYEGYVKATAALESTLYGEQKEYWDAFKRLKNEANGTKGQQSAKDEDGASSNTFSHLA